MEVLQKRRGDGTGEADQIISLCQLNEVTVQRNQHVHNQNLRCGNQNPVKPDNVQGDMARLEV